MKDIELIIKIDEAYYNEILAQGMTGAHLTPLYEALVNSTPLPKGCDIQRIIPKRVNVQKWIYTKCPNCKRELSTHHSDGYYSIEHKPDFCPSCGQALLWESEG